MKIVGMIPIYNEEDIIQEVIDHLLSQKIEIVILDNGSTDGSYEICKSYLGKGVLKLEKYESNSWNAALIKEMLYHMAIEQNPDWLILNDADELIESPEKEDSLKDAIEKADKQGYNLIQLDRFDFFMTQKDKSEIKYVKQRMKYYSYQGDYVYRIWKYFPGIKIGDTAGHYPIFPGNHIYKIFKKKFIMRHYPFRTPEQAKRKMKERERNTEQSGKPKIPLNAHYKKIKKQNFENTIDTALLSKYEEDGRWDLSLKFQPFETITPPTRDELFTEDGFLRNPPLSAYELKLLLNEKWDKSLASRIYRKVKPKRNSRN